MKRLVTALLVWLLAAIPAIAQSGTTIWLPVIYSTGNPCNEVVMSDWKIVIPQATTNMALNPSAEIAGNFAAAAGTTVTRVTTYQHYGLYSYRVESNANNEGIQLTLSALTNAIHYVTVRVRGTLPAAWDWSLDNATYTAPTLLEQIDSNWALYGLQFPAAQANGSTTLYIYQNGAGSGDYYLDGIQVEAKSTWTTYCDGTQPGCAWNGIAHASTSTRSAYSRAGGQVYDLETDYYLNVGGMSGTGTPPQNLGIDKYATLPGGELNSLKVDSRVFTLTGVITGTSQSDFHSKKQTLFNALSPDAYPEDENGVQPVRLRYHGATIHKEIAAHYDGGLEGELSASDPCAWERVAVRFLSPDPYWYEIGESAAALDTNDSATFRLIAGRLKSTEQWSALGPPDAAGTYNRIYALAEDETYLYIGGNFSNFNNIAAADNIVRYNKQTGVYSAMGSGLSDIVYVITVASDGNVFIGGQFLNAGGVANADYLTYWDGANFNAVGNPNSGGATITYIRSLVFSKSGVLYIGGGFLNLSGLANADGIVSWDGGSYAALSTGLPMDVGAMAFGLDGLLYVGGSPFIGEPIQVWDGLTFADVGTGGPSTAVLSLVVDSNTGVLYAGLTTPVTYHVMNWNGNSWSGVGNPPNNNVKGLQIKDGILIAVGDFDKAGGISLSEGISRFNGYAWSHMDIDFPSGAITVDSVLISKYGDPILSQKYDLFVGTAMSGTGYFAGKVTATNDGNVPAQPRFIVYRTGGTTATLETLKNETNGKELLYNYALLSGETLTTDLAPTEQSIISSFFGERPDAMLANSDFGSWVLLPGSNSVTSFVATSGAPTVTAHLLWKDRFKSQD